MPSKTFPPKFDSSITYPAIYNLDELEVFQEAESGVYFDINQLPEMAFDHDKLITQKNVHTIFEKWDLDCLILGRLTDTD